MTADPGPIFRQQRLIKRKFHHTRDDELIAQVIRIKRAREQEGFSYVHS